MAGKDRDRSGRFVMALLVSIMVGVIVTGAWENRVARLEPEKESDPRSARGTVQVPEPVLKSLANDYQRAAWLYAQALQEGNWGAAIERTLWMQDRLKWIDSSSDSSMAVPDARAELVRALSDQEEAGNRLRQGGVEDQYVFTPGAKLELWDYDQGREDLAAPVAERLWIRVTYPSRTRALRDSASIPIRRLVVGLNVSEDRYVLKASVIGNLDIDWDSVAYDWPADPG